jgi:CRISPR/Cas system-associated exonuclease Cas4 (RecB family)
MTLQSPEAQPLERLSPSRYQDLLVCPLRVAHAQAGGGKGPKSDPQIVGEAAHAVLQELVETRALLEPDWRSRIAPAFEAQLGRFERSVKDVGGARLARARLATVAERVKQLLTEAGADADVLCEEELEALGARLHGVVDLIINASESHLVVDYKTGAALEESGEADPKYLRQLQLYAVLERERSDSWPSRALLVPFGGSPLEVEVDPEECSALGKDLVRRLEEWNDAVGSVPEARPSPDNCRFCSYAGRCEALWSDIDEAWSDQLIAVAGVVAWAQTSAAGGVTAQLHSSDGSRIGGVIVQQLPAEPPLAAGDVIRLVGLREDRDGRLLPTRSLRVAFENA